MPRQLYTVIILLLVMSSTSADPFCKIVSRGIWPCLSYIRGKHHHKSEKPSYECCKGMNSIENALEKYQRDDRAAFLCISSRIHFSSTRYTHALYLCIIRSSLPSVGHSINFKENLKVANGC
ncbi:non-specific lipid-transfer protein 2-like [Capsicum annuum]